MHRKWWWLGVLIGLAPFVSGAAAPAVAPSSVPQPQPQSQSQSLIAVPVANASVLGTPADLPLVSAVAGESTDRVPGTTPPDAASNDVRASWVRPAPLVDNPFAVPVGAWLGGDIPRIYPLPDGRQVWWLNDSFVPVDGQPAVDQFDLVRNIVFVRGLDGSLDTRVGDRAGVPWDFLAHPDPDHFHRFFWPLGGEVDGPLLKVFIAEMECSDPQWGVCARPVTTWLATYSWADMQLVDLQPAANPGVRPVYGFSVVSDTDWSYLFGAGAEYNTPHIPGGSDQTYVARVPRGKLEQAPEYWDGRGWNPDPGTAVSLIQRGYADFRMSVIPWKGHYLGVAKEDEFVGPATFVMSAPAPQGPWTGIAVIPMPTNPGEPDLVTYDAEPYPEPIDGKLAIVYSANSTTEKRVFADPSVYRPVLLMTDIE